MRGVVRAVILAAGASSRMGRPKAALPMRYGGDTFVSRVIRTCLASGLPDIVVVTGAHDDAVQRAMGRPHRAVRRVHNPAWQSGQLSSLLAGLGDRDDPRLEALLLTLVDAPFITEDTYRRVLHTWRTTRAPIVRPARGDVHGHPVVFDQAVFEELRRADPNVGAKAVVRARAADIVNVAVEDEGAFVDVDTADDYESSLERFSPDP
jgi:molybdenum cofactor cytidylyltransferase